MNGGIKRVTLELGGKNPNIILNDADLDFALQQSHLAAFLNSGQVCMSGSRTYVQEGIYDEYVARTIEIAKKKKVGDPLEADTENGPQISKQQLSKIMNYIDIGQKEGAKLLAGGKKLDRPGYFVETTVFGDV